MSDDPQPECVANLDGLKRRLRDALSADRYRKLFPGDFPPRPDRTPDRPARRTPHREATP